MADAALIMQGFGGGLSATAQWRAANARRRLGEFNAAQLEQRALDATRRGETEAARVKTSASQLAGAQRAGYAASGVDVGVGTPVDIVRETAALSAADALQLRMNAANEAWGYRSGAAEERQAGESDARNMKSQAVAGLLGGLGSAALRQWGFNNSPAGGSGKKATVAPALPGIGRAVGGAVVGALGTAASAVGLKARKTKRTDPYGWLVK